MRIASAWISVSLKRAMSFCLGIVLEADDADHLVDVEEGNEIAVQHLEAMLDLVQPELRAPHQHVDAVLEPLPQHARAATARWGSARAESTFMLRPKRTSSSVSRNRLSISSIGSTARLFGSSTRRISSADLVAHVSQQRQLLLGQKVGDLLDQLRLLHLIGDLGDDDLVACRGPYPPWSTWRAAGSRRGRSCRPR